MPRFTFSRNGDSRSPKHTDRRLTASGFAAAVALLALALTLSGCGQSPLSGSATGTAVAAGEESPSGAGEELSGDGLPEEAESISLDAQYSVEQGNLMIHLTCPEGFNWDYAATGNCVELVNQVTNRGKYHVSFRPVANGVQQVVLRMMEQEKPIQYFACTVTVQKGEITDVSDPAFFETSELDVAENDKGPRVFPEFVYDDPDDPLTSAVLYSTLRLQNRYAPGDITIPAAYLVSTDDMDPANTVVYGQFFVYRFDLVENALQLVSGGAEVGVMHFSEQDGVYVLTGMKTAGGADLDAIQKATGAGDEMLGLLTADYSREIAADVLQYLSDYVNAYGIPADRYLDAAGGAVMLLPPEESPNE